MDQTSASTCTGHRIIEAGCARRFIVIHDAVPPLESQFNQARERNIAPATLKIASPTSDGSWLRLNSASLLFTLLVDPDCVLTVSFFLIPLSFLLALYSYALQRGHTDCVFWRLICISATRKHQLSLWRVSLINGKSKRERICLFCTILYRLIWMKLEENNRFILIGEISAIENCKFSCEPSVRWLWRIYMCSFKKSNWFESLWCSFVYVLKQMKVIILCAYRSSDLVFRSTCNWRYEIQNFWEKRQTNEKSSIFTEHEEQKLSQRKYVSKTARKLIVINCKLNYNRSILIIVTVISIASVRIVIPDCSRNNKNFLNLCLFHVTCITISWCNCQEYQNIEPRLLRLEGRIWRKERRVRVRDKRNKRKDKSRLSRSQGSSRFHHDEDFSPETKHGGRDRARLIRKLDREVVCMSA